MREQVEGRKRKGGGGNNLLLVGTDIFLIFYYIRVFLNYILVGIALTIINSFYK